MKIITETQRLILRELRPSDAKSFFDLNSDPEVLKYTGDVSFSSISDAELFLNSYSDYQKNGFGRWAVLSKSNLQFLGWCGLKLNEENLIDLGYRFFQNEWGKGYATEAAYASLNYGFNQLSMKEIIGRSSSENKASIAVLKKLNMTFWKNDDCEGIENSVYYRINHTQFDQLKRKG